MRSIVEFAAVAAFAFLCSILAFVVAFFHTQNTLFLDVLSINVSVLSFLWAAANLELSKQEGDRAVTSSQE